MGGNALVAQRFIASQSQSIETPGMAFKGLRATAEMINQLFEKIPVETPITK